MKLYLGEIVERIQTGPFGSQLHRHDYTFSGTPVIMPQDIDNWRLSTEKIAYVDNDTVERLSRHKVSLNDIIYPRRGNVSKCAIIGKSEQDWLCGTGCLKITINPEKANPKYVFYYLQQETIGKWIEGHATGATMLNINSRTLESLPLDLPEIPIQNRVIEILSAYDEMIDTCKQQIALLEEAAQRLYREWFVDMRFPGHKTTPIGENGLPEGWSHSTLRDFLYIKSGKDHKVLQDGLIPVYGSGGIMRYGDKALYGKASILIPRKGSLNNILLVEGGFWTIDTMFYTEMKEEGTLYFTYQQIKDWDLYAQNIGAAVPSMNTTILYSRTMLRPSKKIIEQFNNLISPYYSRIFTLKHQLENLIEVKNLLLPRLISGQIEITA